MLSCKHYFKPTVCMAQHGFKSHILSNLYNSKQLQPDSLLGPFPSSCEPFCARLLSDWGSELCQGKGLSCYFCCVTDCWLSLWPIVQDKRQRLSLICSELTTSRLFAIKLCHHHVTTTLFSAARRFKPGGDFESLEVHQRNMALTDDSENCEENAQDIEDKRNQIRQ